MEDRVTLTAYADEIRELIHHDRNTEAIALCRHILRFYPKCVDTIRQVAEACLEQHEYDAAQDLFRRVLSADPENAVAYVGLASIFEERQLMDEAVWHMERAFELSPAHPEIHKELLRLHTLNSRKTRARLKMTPGALARLYAYQGLLAQATQELRAIVAGDPTRLDTRTALVEMLWRTGRIHEAAQVAQDLLGPLPYCLKANLILGTAWKESGLPESEAYLQRAQQLDPTNRVAANLLGARSPLLPVEPTVPRYVEGAPAPVVTITPVAAPTPFDLTVPVEETPFAPEPEVVSVFDQAPAPTPTVEMPAESATDVEIGPSAKPELPITALPPWLRGEGVPSTAETSEMPPVKPAVAEEGTALPQWISQAPDATAREPEEILPPTWRDTLATPAEETAPTDTTFDWLNVLRQKQIVEEPAPEEPEPPAIFVAQPPAEIPAELAHAESVEPESELPSIFAEQPSDEIPAQPTRAETAEPEFELPAIFAEQPSDEIPAQPTRAETAEPEFELPAIFAGQPGDEIPAQPTRAETAEPEFELPSIFAEQPGEEIPAQPTRAETAEPEFELPAIFAGQPGEEIPAQPTRAETAEPEFELPSIFAEQPGEETTEPEVPSIFADQPRAETAEPEFELPSIFAERPGEEIPVEPARAGTAEPEFELPAIFAEQPRPEIPAEPVSAARERRAALPPEPKVRKQPKGYSHLILAREHRDDSRWNDALVEYDWVIQHAPRFIAEVIVDVESLVRRAGVPLEAHRVLGDAYTRAGRLNDALERYRYLRERLEASEA
ncbi:MAG: tetratricopeptide repeat protein [Chloroflexi bacterium]|nr:tetratricopeptide repeat protein [Chloroflexota bacterium]